MAVRLEEVHPAIVHYPLALPVAVGADLLGRATGSDALATVGRTLMPIAAASAVVSAVTGLATFSERTGRLLERRSTATAASSA